MNDMHYMETQEIDICDMPTLEYPILSADDTEKTPVTPIPSLPEEVASGPAWQLYQHGTSYGLVLHTLTDSLVFALETPHLKLLGFDIHAKYKRLESEGGI